MALIKDVNGVAIVRFENGLIKTVNSSGEIVNTSNYAYTYNQHSGAGMAMGVSPSKNDTVLVKADVSAAGNGYIFGNTNVNIRKNGTNMIWNIGGTDVATHAIENGFHVYGIVMDGTNEKMRAFYDGSFLDTVGHAPTTPGSNYYIGSNSTSGGASGVRIAEVMALVSPTSGANKAYFHFYPTNGGNYYETRYYAAQISATSTSSGTLAPYGITLDDVKYATGSKYKDLTAIVCEDGGVDTSMGWTADTANAAYSPSSPYNSHTFAINLKGVPICGGTGPNTGSELKGELIKGRKPKWNIWNNAVNFGFHVTNPATNVYQLKFNLVRDFTGTTKTSLVELSAFENYSSVNRNYPPQFNVSGNCEIEYNNAIPFKTDLKSMIVGKTRSDNESVLCERLFMLNDSSSLSATARIGNAAPWGFTTAQADASGYAIWGFVVTLEDNSNVLIHSVDNAGVKLNKDVVNTQIGSTGVTYGQKYRVGPVSVLATLNSKYTRLIYSLLNTAPNNKIGVDAKFALLGVNTSTPEESDLIRLAYLMPAKTAYMHGNLNYGIRHALDDHTDRSSYYIAVRCGVVTTSGGGRLMHLNANVQYELHGGVLIPIIPCNSSGMPQKVAKDYYAIITTSTCSTGSTKDIESQCTILHKLIPPSQITDERFHNLWVEGEGRAYAAHNWDGQGCQVSSRISDYTDYDDYTRCIHVLDYQLLGSSSNSPVAFSANTTFVYKLFDEASVPVVILANGLWQHTARSIYTQNPARPKAYVYSQPHYESSRSSWEGIVYVRKYNYTGLDTWVYDPSTDFTETVHLYKNGGTTPVAEFTNINLQPGATQDATDDNGGYHIAVGMFVLHNYWYDPSGARLGSAEFFRLKITRNAGCEAISPGDYFSIDIVL